MKKRYVKFVTTCSSISLLVLLSGCSNIKPEQYTLQYYSDEIKKHTDEHKTEESHTQKINKLPVIRKLK
jgi:hypothetical protein